MQNDAPLDMLQIKIDRAKEALPKETREAIDSVGWRGVILSIREKKGYNFEQLDELETETELLLCGLLNPEDYPKELEERMKIPKPQVDELVNEMNELVFKKIKDELIRNTEKKEIFIKKAESITNETKTENAPVLNNSTEIETMPEELTGNTNQLPITNEQIKMNENKPTESIFTQKLSGSFQMPTTKTDYSLKNIQPTSPQDKTSLRKGADPYRELPE